VSERYDCTDPAGRAEGLRAATAAIGRQELVVLPTDTVYGVAADAFSPQAVEALLAAKGRDRAMPVPVLVSSWRMLDGVVDHLPDVGRALGEAFWPGALTLVARHVPALSWDLGETRGTVAVRIPLHPLVLDLLAETGPLAVSSANRSGAVPATTGDGAESQLGSSVAVYLDGGPCAEPVPSAIVDVTSGIARVLRVGAIPLDRLREMAPDLELPD
jgi:L-threonylcarbamoyladenylate synthase